MSIKQSEEKDGFNVSEEISVEKSAAPKWKQRTKKFFWPIHAWFPNIFPNPYGSEKNYYLKKDSEDNADSSLEENVNLQLGCMFVSEIYGPKEINSLYDGLVKVGWERDRYSGGEDSNIEWLKRQRLYGTGGTLSIGGVHRPEEIKKYVGVRYTAKFPKEFSSLLVKITQLTPSVTCLSIGFILTEEASFEYANEINRPAQTTFLPRRRSRPYSIMAVAHVKEERVQRVRSKYRNLGISWICKNFPGFFGKNSDRLNFPTAEFLSLDGFTPFDRRGIVDSRWDHWTRFVNISHYFGTWKCTSTPSLGFSLDSGMRKKLPNHMTIALRWDTLSDEDRKGYSGESLDAKTYFVNSWMNGIISRYALTSYLRELLRELKQTRQSLSVSPSEHKSPVEISKISEFFRRSLGVPSIAREVIEISKDDASFRWNSMGFNRQKTHEEDSNYDIKEGLKSFLGRLAQELLEEDKGMREYLNQLSSAIGIKESIAAQRRMEFITIVALAVAVVSMIVAISS